MCAATRCSPLEQLVHPRRVHPPRGGRPSTIVDMRYSYALKMAERLHDLPITVRSTPMKYGWHRRSCHPLFGENCSGSARTSALFRAAERPFYDRRRTQSFLSDVGRLSIAGQLSTRGDLLESSRGVQLLQALVPGFRRPYTSPSRRRTALRSCASPLITRPRAATPWSCAVPIRPATLSDLRVLLAGGLEGVEKGYDCSAPMEKNL